MLWLLASRLGAAYRLAKGDMYVVEAPAEHVLLLEQLSRLLKNIGTTLLPSRAQTRRLLPARPEVRELVNLLSLLASRPPKDDLVQEADLGEASEASVPQVPLLCSSQTHEQGALPCKEEEELMCKVETDDNCKAEEMCKVVTDDNCKAELADELEDKSKEEEVVVAEAMDEASLMASCAARVDERLAKELQAVKAECFAQFRVLLAEKDAENEAKVEEERAKLLVLANQMRAFRKTLCKVCKGKALPPGE